MTENYKKWITTFHHQIFMRFQHNANFKIIFYSSFIWFNEIVVIYLKKLFIYKKKLNKIRKQQFYKLLKYFELKIKIFY